MADLVKVLDRVDEILADESRWIKFALALNAEGELITEEGIGDEAVGWCLSGAVLRALFDLGSTKASESDWTEVLIALEGVIDRAYFSVPDFNDADETTFADIKAVIARAKEKIGG